jgi:hypothetical protein
MASPMLDSDWPIQRLRKAVCESAARIGGG